MLVTPLERLIALNQPRQANDFLALQQCKVLLIHGVHQISPKFHTKNCNNFCGFRMFNISSYYCGINGNVLWTRSTLIHSVRAACYGLDKIP
jgi:hypothetical protein